MSNHDDHDQIVKEYARRRNLIAKANNLTQLKDLSCDGYQTAKVIDTDIRADFSGMLLLQKFERLAVKSKGGCYSDDGETIAIWADPAKEVRKKFRVFSDGLKAKIGHRVLFHPGYLPYGRKPWPLIRIQNPNPTPYFDRLSGRIDWSWFVCIKPGLKLRLPTFDFFVGEKFEGGGQWGIHAEIRRAGSNGSEMTETTYDAKGVAHRKTSVYVSAHNYVTTQARLDELVVDIRAYIGKLKAVKKRYEDAGLAETSPKLIPDKVRSKLWNLTSI